MIRHWSCGNLYTVGSNPTVPTPFYGNGHALTHILLSIAVDWTKTDTFLERTFRKSHSINSRRYYKFEIEEFKRFCDAERIRSVNSQNVYNVLDSYVGYARAASTLHWNCHFPLSLK